jgi:hypothetical protein
MLKKNINLPNLAKKITDKQACLADLQQNTDSNLLPEAVSNLK